MNVMGGDDREKEKKKEKKNRLSPRCEAETWGAKEAFVRCNGEERRKKLRGECVSKNVWG